MKTILKYEIQPIDTQYVPMAKGAVIRHVGVQHGNLCIWAESEQGAEIVNRVIRMYGTGVSIPANQFMTFIGTVLSEDQSTVAHIYIQ